MERRYRSAIAASLALGLGLGVASAGADQLLVDSVRDMERQRDAGPRPGTRMEQVEQRFGEPAGRQGPVGQPPITRWDYSDYSVYFEHERVLHTVHQR